MVSVVTCLLGALLLLGAAVTKVAGGAAARAALATYGLRGEAAATAWAALVAVELALAIGVALGQDRAAYATAALLAAFTVVQAVALASGRDGAPCACFGARGRLSRGSLARTVALTAGFAVLPLLPRDEPSTEGWLAIGLGGALLGLAALTVVVLALAREIGDLRRTLAPEGALEIPHEGPELGGRTALVETFGPELAERGLGLAVFTSEGCGMCRALGPAIAELEHDPRVAVRTFDEVRDADAWAVADAPGSPYAVALDAAGTVLAKGTFNSAAQLESVLATAGRRRGGALRG